MGPTAQPLTTARRLRNGAAAVARSGRGTLVGLALLALLFLPAQWFLGWLATLPRPLAEAVALSAASIWICHYAARRCRLRGQLRSRCEKSSKTTDRTRTSSAGRSGPA